MHFSHGHQQSELFKSAIFKCENRIFYKVFPHLRQRKFFMKIVRYCFCLLVMHYDDNSFSKNVDQIMRYKVGQSWSRLSPNCQILPKKEFLLANLNVKFMYQLHPIMLPKISQISLQWVMRYKVTYIYGNLIQTTHLPHSEIFFGKKYVTFAYLLCPIIILNISKKIITVNHDIKGCKNVGSKLPISPRNELVLES